MSDEQDNHRPAPDPGQNGRFPQPGVPAWVQCGASQTAAYRDANGVWRSYARGQQLKHPVTLVALILSSRSRPWRLDLGSDWPQQTLGLFSLLLYPFSISV